MKYSKLINNLQTLISKTPKQAELCQILGYTASKISAHDQMIDIISQYDNIFINLIKL